VTIEEPPVEPPAREVKANRPIDYSCSECRRKVGREHLMAVRVQFKEMGVHGRIVKTRTTEWLCTIPQENGDQSCLDSNPAWQADRMAESPGFKGTRIAP